MSARYQTLRGTRDILPDEAARWRFVESTARDRFARYGYGEIRTPILESTELFARSVGETTDIVRKEMYTFERGSESVTLRPENTASVVRAFLQHALYREVAAGYPAKLYYIGPMFRYERPQAGRQRQFHQIGVEVLGAAEPEADAECLRMLDRFLDALGIGDRALLLNTLGDPEERDAYRETLRAWAAPRLDPGEAELARMLRENPLRLLDSKLDAAREAMEGAPTLLETLSGDSRRHFDAVCAALDAGGIAYAVEPRLVRGLDYYRRTVFEVTSGGLGAQNAILGGGVTTASSRSSAVPRFRDSASRSGWSGWSRSCPRTASRRRGPRSASSRSAGASPARCRWRRRCAMPARACWRPSRNGRWAPR